MKRFFFIFFVVAIFAILVFPVSGDFQEILDKADELHKMEDYDGVKSFLTDSLDRAKDGSQKAELYWRMARVFLNFGDKAEDRGLSEKEVLYFFEEGEAYAQKAIEFDPKNHLAYYWKSGNIGRWGQIKGILNSLFKARPMKNLLQKAVTAEPEHADSYYVLGQLYEQVPGFPISFGNKDYAVSLGRKSIDLRAQQVSTRVEDELDYDFYTEMAKHLYARKWKSSKRLKEQKKKKSKYNSASDILEKNFYYEGVVTLKEMSDRQEAKELIAWTIKKLESISNRTGSQNDDLKEAHEVQAGFK